MGTENIGSVAHPRVIILSPARHHSPARQEPRLTKPNPPLLIPNSNRVPHEDLLRRLPDQQILACDFYVEGIERGDDVPGGYRLGTVTNIDHHAPTARMVRRISSTNLAIDHVHASGAATADAAVVINHTDCDSVLSSAIVAGLLRPDEKFGAAAIAADHTGEADPIADLLQSLEPARDLDLSLRNLRRLLAGERLEGPVEAAVSDRLSRRGLAAELVEQGTFRQIGGVDVAVLPREVEGEFFPPLLPEAAVIMVTTPMRDHPGRWHTKLRLGLAAPEGLTLHRLTAGLDEGYGGRWNAGSNKRGGGTALEPEAYAQLLDHRVQELTGGAERYRRALARPMQS